jgi:hypothetical protein
MLDTGKELYKIEGGRYTAQGARCKTIESCLLVTCHWLLVTCHWLLVSSCGLLYSIFPIPDSIFNPMLFSEFRIPISEFGFLPPSHLLNFSPSQLLTFPSSVLWPLPSVVCLLSSDLCLLTSVLKSPTATEPVVCRLFQSRFPAGDRPVDSWPPEYY